MIYFDYKPASHDLSINGFIVPEGEDVLKIEFDRDDVKILENGKAHIDLWGKKLGCLKAILGVKKSVMPEMVSLSRINQQLKEVTT